MLCQLSYRPVTSKRSGWVVLPIALLRVKSDPRYMNEIWDAAAVAEEFTRAGIEPAATARLAQAVRTNGAAAVHALGAGAFGDWKTASALNRLIAGAFDAGCDKRAVAAELEVVGQLQLMLQQEFVLL